MKNIFLQLLAKPALYILWVAVFLFCFSYIALAQPLATYPLKSGGGNPTPGTASPAPATSANVTAGTMIPGSSMQAASFSSLGYRVRPNAVPWPPAPVNGYGFDIPLSPKAGWDMSLTGITMSISDQDYDLDGATTMYIVPYFQVDGTASWMPLAAAQPIPNTPTTLAINFGTINEVFYNTHTYVVRFYVYSTDNAGSKDDNFRASNIVFNGSTYQPPAQPATVTTLTAVKTGKYTGTATGSYSFNGNQFYSVKRSGIIWSTSQTGIVTLDTSTQTKTTNGASGIINSTLTGLSAGTTYYAKAYIVTQFGIQYGTVLTFTTDPPIPPVVTTTVVTDILSNKATGGGVVVDSGGLFISEKGLVWNLESSAPATVAANLGKIILGNGSQSFSDLMKGLQPNTKYCARAYAINPLGTSYGAEECFETTGPQPVLVTIPGTLNFGRNFNGSAPFTIPYNLVGSNLTPGSGNITATAPAGFLICATAQGTFTSTLTIAYQGSKLDTLIYVQLSTANLGTFTGNITHSGGGVSVANADVVKLNGSILTSPANVTSLGTEFWTGFGYHGRMRDDAPNLLSLYIAAPEGATGVVSFPGIPGAASKPFTIPANGAVEIQNFPSGPTGPDARLFQTGIFDRGIHITSDKPISVYNHTHGSDVSGSTLIFPVNAWGSSYTVSTIGGVTNTNAAPNSFFFVIASEDNTEVIFKPSADVISSTTAAFSLNHTAANVQYQAGQTYSIILNRGQIFNAMGKINGSTGVDLTGTTVTTRECGKKKIAVYAGNGRVYVPSQGCSPSAGSDNIISQMFPRSAWGTKYVSSPFKQSTYSKYRILVQSASTQVKLNGVLLTGLNPVGNYYEFENKLPNVIISDQPVMMVQYMMSGGCNASTGNINGTDPEMIILSPIQQSLNNLTVYSAQKDAVTRSLINVVIKNEGTALSSFRLDNAPVTGWVAHPQDNLYSYITLDNVTMPRSHNLRSDSGFTAIAYGFGSDSYGYNAGTALKDLSTPKLTLNEALTIDGAKTCKDESAGFQIALPYTAAQITAIKWSTVNDPAISPFGDFSGSTTPVRTYQANGQTYYVYASPGKFSFSSVGIHKIEVTVEGTFVSECGGSLPVDIDVEVVSNNINFSAKSADGSCGNPKITFTNLTTPDVANGISTWSWNFGDGSDTVKLQSPAAPPDYTYPNVSNPYTASLTAITNIGCVLEKKQLIDFSSGVKADFSVTPLAACVGEQFTITDASSANVVSWEWNFGDNTTATGKTPSAKSYTTSGQKNITLIAKDINNCAATLMKTVTVEATPVAGFSATTVCFGNSTTFTDTSKISVGSIDTRIWNFGDGGADVTDNNPTITHKYAVAGRYEVSLSVKSVGGCTSTTLFKDSITVVPLPKDSFDIDVNCTTKEVTFTDKSITNGGTITTYNWIIDGIPVTHGATFKQTFNDVLSHTVSLTVQTSNGCKNAVGFSRSFTISASPVADFDLPAKVCLPNDAAIFTNKTTISDGTQNTISYQWTYGDNSVENQAAPAPGTISHPYATATTYNVKLTATSAAGCTNSITKLLNTVYPQPKASFTLPTEVCVNAKAALSATGVNGTDWYWNFGTGFGTLSKKDTVASWNIAGDTAVKHYYINALGCISDTVSKTIKVNPLPNNGFDKIIDCSIKKVTFTDTSSTAVGTINKRHWDFGDGVRDDGNNATATHTYTSNGPFTATLWVESSKGCQDSSNRASVTFTISATPASSFDLPTNNICLPVGVAIFTNTSTISDGTASGFVNSWDYGDGSVKDTTIGLTNAQHTYTAVGPYTIKLTTTSANGCTNIATAKVLNTIYAQPKANFSPVTEACLNTRVAFTGAPSTAAGGQTVAEWHWDLATGSFGTVSQQDTAATWNTSGPKDIQLYVVSDKGCISDTVLKTVTINDLPIAKFKLASTAGCAGKLVTFNDNGSDFVVPGTTLTKWHYLFGDGKDTTVNRAADVTHTYALGGSYDAKLVVTNSKGCESDTSSIVTVNVYANPVIDFSAIPNCLATSADTTTLSFADKSSVTDADGIIASRTWDFGDASTVGTDSALDHTYHAGGSYPVILTATSNHDCKTVGTAKEVTAYTTPVAAGSVIITDSLCSSDSIKFVNQSTVNFSTVKKIEIFWDNQGDPSQKTTDNAPVINNIYKHKYADLSADKDYEIVIRAYSNADCYNDSVQTIKVGASPDLTFLPIAAICEEKSVIQIPVPVDANNLAMDSIHTFFRGDGIIDTAKGLFLPRSAGPGNHKLYYTKTSLNGCATTKSQTVFVYPTPGIKMPPTRALLLGDKITLKPIVTGSIQSFEWTPGTFLNFTDIQTPVSKPTEDITYTLKVTSNDGCEADSSVMVNVLQDFPVPNTFTPNNDGINDYWIIKELPSFPVQRVQVFDRYGQVVYETRKYDAHGWDGTYKGKPLPIGTYYYIIELDGMLAPKVGYVTLIK